jgi:hypothetical protein
LDNAPYALAGATFGRMFALPETVGAVGRDGVGSFPSFASRSHLENHFLKHGREFKGSFTNADEYLSGAHDVIKDGIKVIYGYKGESRVGYVRFAGTSQGRSVINSIKYPGVSKFEFVGTNNNGYITTYHIESGKDFWKTINGVAQNKNITPYNYKQLESKLYQHFGL